MPNHFMGLFLSFVKIVYLVFYENLKPYLINLNSVFKIFEKNMAMAIQR